MSLPAHLAKYDSLIDLMVDELVREIESESTSQHTARAARGGDKHVDGTSAQAYDAN